MNPKPPSPATIAEVIKCEGGRVTFARFMELALTHPSLGYYSKVDRLLWHEGDFSTAPAISPYFNRTVAKLVAELLDASFTVASGSDPGPGEEGERVGVVELGGGEGQLAAAILGFLDEQQPELRDRISYRIVEVGSLLRKKQAAALDRLLTAGWEVVWGLNPAEACAGSKPAVIVGNEFLDTVPVHLVDVSTTRAREAYVSEVYPSLAQTWGPLSAEAAVEIESLFGTLDPSRLRAFTEDGIIEVFPGVGTLMQRVVEVMPSGSLVGIDYGEWFPGVSQPGTSQVCSPCGLAGRVRRRRTVRGYFRHQVVMDPLARAGKQDLTADVDFAAVDFHGRRHGFETVLYTTLAAFLAAGGAEQELEALRGGVAGSEADPLEADRQATVLRNLLNEEDLGGAFKVMVQVRE